MLASWWTAVTVVNRMRGTLGGGLYKLYTQLYAENAKRLRNRRQLNAYYFPDANTYVDVDPVQIPFDTKDESHEMIAIFREWEHAANAATSRTTDLEKGNYD